MSVVRYDPIVSRFASVMLSGGRSLLKVTSCEVSMKKLCRRPRGPLRPLSRAPAPTAPDVWRADRRSASAAWG